MLSFKPGKLYRIKGANHPLWSKDDILMFVKAEHHNRYRKLDDDTGIEWPIYALYFLLPSGKVLHCFDSESKTRLTLTLRAEGAKDITDVWFYDDVKKQ